MSDDEFDPYHKWLGIPKGHRPPTFYQLLGISPDEQDAEVIRTAAKRQEDFVRKFSDGPYKSDASSLSFQLQEARLTLLNAKTRKHYDSKLGLIYERQRKNVREFGHSLAGGGAASVGEESGLAREFLKIMSVILAGFIIMAAVAYRLDWIHLRKEAEKAIDEADQLVARQVKPEPAPAVKPMLPPEAPDRPQAVKVDPPPITPPVNPPETVATIEKEEVTNSIGMRLRLIPAGEFQMGSRRTERRPADRGRSPFGLLMPDEEQALKRSEAPHQVRITKPFYLGKYEVTRGQFRKFVEATKYITDAERNGPGGLGLVPTDRKVFANKREFTWQNPGFEQTDDHPVVLVSWNDANEFCGWLSKHVGPSYRLPTDAEWEYACRAGTTTLWSSGDDFPSVALMANVKDTSMSAKLASFRDTEVWDDGHPFTAPVGRFKPNLWGLHDMHGNVMEWCQDWHDPDYYAKSPPVDPTGPPSGKVRSIRGGSWLGDATYCRSAYHTQAFPTSANCFKGFRVARLAAPPSSKKS